MKYIKQFAIILALSLMGELLRYFIPLRISASIYGILLLLILLIRGIVKVEDVKEVAGFLIQIMPLMFVSLGANPINLFDRIKPIIIPLLIIVPLTTFIVMIITGKLTDYVIGRGGIDE